MWSYISLGLPLKVVEIFRWNPRRERERERAKTIIMGICSSESKSTF